MQSTGEKTDRTIRFVEVVSDAEHKLDRLLAEKEMVGIALVCVPVSSDSAVISFSSSLL